MTPAAPEASGRVAVIVNPVAGTRGGRDAGPARAALAEAELAREGVPGVVHLTGGPGEAFALARAAVEAGAGLVVAWGGDGTVNEVGRALAFTPAALGIVPAGSGNGLARALDLPRHPAQALRTALRGPERVADAGELGGRLFFNVAGIGLDARVAARFAGRGPGRRGVRAYAALTLHALATEVPRAYRLRVDGEPRATEALLVACANAAQYGGGARIAPGARLDDGWLDLVVVEDPGPWARFWAVPRLFTGTLERAAGVWRQRFATLEVQADGPIGFHVDGEPATGGSTLHARVHPRALRLRAGPPA